MKPYRKRVLKKGGDLQQHQVAAPTAKSQNTHAKNTEQTPTERDTKGTRNTNSQHRNMKHKRLHIKQRDQWATGADLGRPSATQIADASCFSGTFLLEVFQKTRNTSLSDSYCSQAGCTLLDDIIGTLTGLGSNVLIAIIVIAGIVVLVPVSSIIIYQCCCKKADLPTDSETVSETRPKKLPKNVVDVEPVDTKKKGKASKSTDKDDW
ncbi:hypothetical protein FSP39_021210 [Pinctada imbricata]|uniref:Uncharacterized protein n=1 Tax=Pinctada imbricata TaxID=66713 RepID=A0AA88XQ41_PINIB|nr:hypothetical protein FSP39_021210 [Pinctada imbricata]